jgi:hypothetical protein
MRDIEGPSTERNRDFDAFLRPEPVSVMPHFRNIPDVRQSRQGRHQGIYHSDGHADAIKPRPQLAGETPAP